METCDITIFFTRHARQRCQQRAIQPLIVDAILEFGFRASAANGCEKVFLDKSARHLLRRRWGSEVYKRLESLLDVAIVVKEDTVITAMPTTKRIKNN